jgi:hypothetical protein
VHAAGFCHCGVRLLLLQARGFVKARSRGSIETYTIAISKAIVDEDDDDVVQVGVVGWSME